MSFSSWSKFSRCFTPRSRNTWSTLNISICSAAITILLPGCGFRQLFAIAALIILFTPAWRRSLLPLACILVFISLWLEKGLGLIVGGFEPSPLGAVAHYAPTLPEWSIVAGIWAVGAFLITVFYKIALSVRGEAGKLIDFSVEWRKLHGDFRPIIENYTGISCRGNVRRSTRESDSGWRRPG